MPQSIYKLNIQYYQAVLARTEDETKRQQIVKLLAEEVAKAEKSTADAATLPPA
jgi:hypothetical protein